MKSKTKLALLLACLIGVVSVCVLAYPKPVAPVAPHSGSANAGGPEFEVVADRIWHRPAEIYDETEAKLGLRITNRADKELTFNPAESLELSLKSADGKDLVQSAIPVRFLSEKPLRLAPGESASLMLPTHLCHTRISAVCLGLKSDAGWFWLTGDLLPGNYRLSLRYQNKHSDNSFWTGSAQTESLEVAVRAAFQ